MYAIKTYAKQNRDWCFFWGLYDRWDRKGNRMSSRMIFENNLSSATVFDTREEAEKAMRKFERPYQSSGVTMIVEVTQDDLIVDKVLREL